jgi:NarL family two-component system response regulator YdfI
MIDVLVEASSPDLYAEITDLLRDHSEIRVMESAANAAASESQPQPGVVIIAAGSHGESDSEYFSSSPWDSDSGGSNPGRPNATDWNVGGWNAAGVPVILLVDNPGRRISEALPAGVRAVLPRNITSTEIAAAIEAVAAGLYVFHPSDIDSIPTLRPPSSETLPELGEPIVEHLTPREIEVLQLLSAGLGNKEIAARLSISEHTAKFHVASIMGKLGAATRTEAVTLGIRHGLVMI